MYQRYLITTHKFPDEMEIHLDGAALKAQVWFLMVYRSPQTSRIFFNMLIPSKSVGNFLSRWWPCWDFQPLGLPSRHRSSHKRGSMLAFLGQTTSTWQKVESSKIFWVSMIFPWFWNDFFNVSPPEIATRFSSPHISYWLRCLLPFADACGGLGLASDGIKWDDSTETTIHLSKIWS